MTYYSIGSSNNDWPTFLRLLRQAEIEWLVDVRSSPASRYPHFNRVRLEARLNAEGLGYSFLGQSLGGHPASGEPPDYEVMARSDAVMEGLKQVEEIAARSGVVLTCAEHDPVQCHRFLLLGRMLSERGRCVAHILRDGRIEPQVETEDRLLKLTRQTEADLLASREERLNVAYRNQNRRLWRLPTATKQVRQR